MGMDTPESLNSWKLQLHPRHKLYIIRGVLIFLLVFLLVAGYELIQNLRPGNANSPSAQSAIFFDTSVPTFDLQTKGASGTILYTVTNYVGASVTHGQVAVQGVQTKLTLPRLPDDYYLLQITDHTNGTATSETIPFTVLAPFTQQATSPFGIGAHFTSGNDLSLTQVIPTMGATMVRDDASWSQIEVAPGTYSFNYLDPYMQELQQNSLSPLFVLDYSSRFYDQNETPYDETGLQAFARYARAVVTQFPKQLKAVEVYNEYNGTLSNGPCARDPGCYTRLLCMTYQAIKAVRPDITVVGGAVFGNDVDWFKQVFADGGLSCMDVVSDHPYTALYIASPEVQGLEENMQNLQQLIQQYNHGQSKPIWITEMGWTTATLYVSEQTQANFLVRGMILGLAAGVQKIFWYDLLNDGNNAAVVQQNFGLLRVPDQEKLYTPKPAYTAYAVLVRELTSRQFLRRESVAPGAFDMLFSHNLRVLWTTLFRKNIVLTTDHPVTAISLTGQVRTLQPVDGKIMLALSAEPVYIQGTISGISSDD